jgi:hypothetical protein
MAPNKIQLKSGAPSFVDFDAFGGAMGPARALSQLPGMAALDPKVLANVWLAYSRTYFDTLPKLGPVGAVMMASMAATACLQISTNPAFGLGR